MKEAPKTATCHPGRARPTGRARSLDPESGALRAILTLAPGYFATRNSGMTGRRVQ